MGTRNLTLVIHKGKIRMAQYGQWDGYPQGVGKDIAKVLKSTTLKALREAIEKCVFIDAKKINGYYKDAGAGDSEWITMDVADSFKEVHPLLDRDYSGGKALSVILEAAKKQESIELSDSSGFAADSLFCEWAYVIDLDKKRVEVYKGFNQSPLGEKDRFHDMKPTKCKSGTYYPVRLMKSYAIKDFTPRAVDALTKKLEKERE